MSRPQKMHKPLKGDFNEILAAVALGKGSAKRAASKARREQTERLKPTKPGAHGK
jgi:hypothetical protein